MVKKLSRYFDEKVPKTVEKSPNDGNDNLIQTTLLPDRHEVDGRLSAEADLDVTELAPELGLVVDVPAARSGVLDLENLTVRKLVLAEVSVL